MQASAVSTTLYPAPSTLILTTKNTKVKYEDHEEEQKGGVRSQY